MGFQSSSPAITGKILMKTPIIVLMSVKCPWPVTLLNKVPVTGISQRCLQIWRTIVSQKRQVLLKLLESYSDNLLIDKLCKVRHQCQINETVKLVRHNPKNLKPNGQKLFPDNTAITLKAYALPLSPVYFFFVSFCWFIFHFKILCTYYPSFSFLTNLQMPGQ